jgi:hypothetical protein
MPTTKLRVLMAAGEAVGGTDALAARLGISPAMMRKYMSGGLQLPDLLFLRAVDCIVPDAAGVAATGLESRSADRSSED